VQAIAKVNELKAVFISLVREWRRLRKSSIKILCSYTFTNDYKI
jgi:hypothetical protein cdivTM_29343